MIIRLRDPQMPPNSSIIREAGRLAPPAARKQMAWARSCPSVTVTLAPFVFLSGLTRISVPLNQTLLPPQSASSKVLGKRKRGKKAEKINNKLKKKNLLPLIKEIDRGVEVSGWGALLVDG